MTSGDRMADARAYAVVTGGGTSGHVLPAIAILDRLVRAGHPRESLHYVGTTRGIERRLVPPTGIDMTLLAVVGLQRSLTPRNLLVAPKMLAATWTAWRLLRRLRPHVVVNVGGYASMPATFAARLARVPVVVVCYDRRPGLASRIASRWAAATATAFDGCPLPRSRTVGAPLRTEILAVDRVGGRAGARAELGLPDDRFVVTVFGGSLGARAVNEAVAGLVERWSDRRDVAVHHVVGERWLADAPPARDGAAGIMYRVIGYEDRMPSFYAASDLMVVRAGASTIAELAATGTPAVVVPWPGAAENHQLDNAGTLSAVGAAVVVEQSELDVDRLELEVQRLVESPDALAAMAAAARAEGARHRDDSLIHLIEEVAA
jgi:UDP-N-acetylglucosamine--N-acetylmuramyl-(pentapeptide) pyrophosphoryl-undecaprenol N-acetylglucosamine transferase